VKKYITGITTIVLMVGGVAFLIWANVATDRADYPDVREFAPNLWFDSEEKYYPTNPLDFYYDENLVEVAGGDARQKYDNLSQDGKLENFVVYYNIDDSGSDLVYQYWLFYVFNDSTNQHYGDWESVFAFLDSNTKEMKKVIGSFHQGSTFNTKAIQNDSVDTKHAWNYVGRGSHANCVDFEGDGACNSWQWNLKEEWSQEDKLHGLKIEYDSPHYDLRPLADLREILGEKYGEGVPMISKDKSPALGMVPLKFGKSKAYVLPFGGNPPSNAWDKKQYSNSQEAVPMTPMRFAASIGRFFENAGNMTAAAIEEPFARLFGGDDPSASLVQTNSSGSDPDSDRDQTPADSDEFFSEMAVDAGNLDKVDKAVAPIIAPPPSPARLAPTPAPTPDPAPADDDIDSDLPLFLAEITSPIEEEIFPSKPKPIVRMYEPPSNSAYTAPNPDSVSPTSTIFITNYASDSDLFTVNWSAEATDLDYYEVEYKIGFSGTWQDWESATTTNVSKNYQNATNGTYYFRVRGTDINQNIGDWQESEGVVIDLYRVVINEIQINDTEFVELYNPTASQIDLNSYYFSYYPSTRISWNGTSTPNGPSRNQPFPNNAKISANGYFLIGLDGYPDSGGNPDSDWQVYASKQMSDSAGTVAIFSFDPTTATTAQFAYDNRVDAVGWGSGISLFEGTSATSTPASGESLTRDNSHTDTDNNSVDFTVAASTTPTNSAGETYVPPPPPSPQPVWAMYQKDARHSGLATLSGPTWTDSSQATTTWIFDIGSARSQPVIDASGAIYAINAIGEVYAINSDGTQKWKFNPASDGGAGSNGFSAASPALSSDGSRLYSVYTDNVPNLKLRLFSIKISDGTLDWKYSPNENGYNQTITSPVTDENGNIYFAGNYNLYSVSSSGSLNWSKTLSPSGLGLKMPAISKESNIEYVYISGIVSNNAGERYIWKLKASDGSEVWKENAIGNNNLANPVSISASSAIYTGGINDSRLYSINPADGSKNWDSALNSGSVSGIAPNFDTNGNIYAGTSGSFDTGKLHKINVAGVVAWSSDAFYSAVLHPAVIDGQGRIYAGAKDNYVYALNSGDGSLIWKYPLSSESRGFAIDSGRLYVVGYDGKVYAFGE